MLFTKTSILLAAAFVATSELQTATAVDYLGGWLPTPPNEQCVDICVNSKAAPTCLTNQPECLAKTQRPGDFDYLLLEQLFMPQLCRDLLVGVDPTISHQNVSAYPNGITCQPEVVTSELTIHGLWPNYNDGYAGCCNVSDSIGNHPFNALEFFENQELLVANMSEVWVDPTQSRAFDSLCEIYNHEFQKHGLCYAASGDNWEQSAVTYFTATLTVAATLQNATQQIADWAASPAAEAPSAAAIQALYPKYTQVFCSAVDGVNQLSAIRTCYEKPANISSEGPFIQKDCALPTATSTFALCDATAPVSLKAYVAPV
ncbi:Ribonuclease [Globisporangium polare]